MNPKTTVGDYEIVDGGNMGESWVDVYAADRLWTPRRINGVPFNGTKDIVIPASGFGIGYLNTTLALQAIPEKYTTSDYSPFEEDSILATLDSYLPTLPINDSGIESTRVSTINEYDIEEYEYTIVLTKPIPPVVFPEGYPGEPVYAMRAFTTYNNERINVGAATLIGNFTWSFKTGWPYVTFELKEWVSDTTLMVEPRILDLPYSFSTPEDIGDFSYLDNITKPYDIAWLICGLTSSGNQELAEKYISNLLTTRDIGMNCFYGYLDMSTGLYKNEYLTTETSAMCTYALAFFASKYPNSNVTTNIKRSMTGFINFLLSTCNDHFYTSDGTYGPGLTNFSTNSNLEGRAKDNILGYLALKIGSTVEGENNLDGLIGHIEQVITVDLWNATDGYFYYSDTDHTTKDCLTQAWGAIFLKAIGDTEKLTKCLASLDQFYTICNDGQIYVEPAAGYRLTPDDDGISFEATFITALARMGNGQLNRGMSDIVSARNMFEELKGSLLVNKSNQARELPAWPTLLSVGIPLVLRKPNGLFGLDYDIHDAGNEDAVHIHDASEILGLEASGVSSVKVGRALYNFNLQSDMVASSDLAAGDRCKTLGYSTIGDDGGADYVIVTDLEIEGKPWAIPIANNLYALCTNTDRVTYKMWGAPLDGINDDGPAMVKAHSYADSVFKLYNSDQLKQYLCRVENHQGTIYKHSNEAINCCSDVDLSGSTLVIDDTNAGWFGYYVWGEVNNLYWDFETPDDVKATFTADNFVIAQNSSDSLPPNTVLKVSEDPYTARDDAGYLYTVARHELIIHDANGICSSPFVDDWKHAGGEEINCQISDLVNGGYTNSQSFSKYSCSYTRIPSKRGVFVGCDVVFKTTANYYCSFLWVKRHNCLVKNFTFLPNILTLHNTKFKNAMIYLWDSYNVRVENIQGFNAAGQQSETGEYGTSGYMLRITNCSDIYVEDCRMQGYWGATAMDSVKNVYFRRCHMNRLDIHDYFSNLVAHECTFYNHNIQIGYGRGEATFTDCNWYWAPIALDSYPSAHLIELNASYGRIFEGTLHISNCRAYIKDAADGEFNIIAVNFSPDATSITKHFKFPEVVVKNVNIYSNNPSVHFTYFKIAGTRRATTGSLAPSHVYGRSTDNTVVWQYYGRGVNWGSDNKAIELDSVLSVVDTFLDSENKTQFYNQRYYRCTQAGTLDFTGNKPSDTTGATVTCGTAQLVYMPDILWKSKYDYSVGDICGTNPSNFYPLYLFRCIVAGVSNGYFPTHTSGTVLEGIDDEVNEPDDCWWTYVANKVTWCTDWVPNMSVTAGQRIEVENRLYKVTGSGTLTAYPPTNNGWFVESTCGTAKVKFVGLRWKYKQWYKNGSYCEARGHIYQLKRHDGTTSGVLPICGNPNCVDGDHIWEYVSPDNQGGSVYSGPTVDWAPSTEYADGTALKSVSNVFVVQQVPTGSSQPTYADVVGTVFMDGERRIQYLGKAKEFTSRTAAITFTAGDMLFDNTFVVQCVTGGLSKASGWGPTADSAWDANEQVTDGTVVWQRLTKTSADGVWRSSGVKYQSGKIYLCDMGESAGMTRVYKSLGGVSGTVAPSDTSGSAFKNDTLSLLYAGTVGNSSWTANTSYSAGDIVVSNGSVYRCVFDGKLTLPSKTIFEDITSNITTSSVFWFYNGTDVPTLPGPKPWTLVVRNCDGVSTSPEGVTTYFGHAGNTAPTVVVS